MHETSLFLRAMNTDVMVAVSAGAGRQTEAQAALRDIETLFALVGSTISRFSPDSELSSLNRAGGRPFAASPTLFSCVGRALAAARATGGLFDPTVLKDLLRAGYDRSFEDMPADSLPPEPPCGEIPNSSWREVRLNAWDRTITMPKDCGLDLGGIAKGWTVDLACRRLRAFESYAVDAGGDIYAAGGQRGQSSWTVAVEDPFALGRDLLSLDVTDRAVATSTTVRRRWRQGGREQHHLVDPRTGQPSQSSVVAVTVVANSVARAEVLAKAALLLGPERGLRFLEAQYQVEGLLILADRRVWRTAKLQEVKNAA
ncbi:MAG: FAD:protein FMN transferase [Dehalococcoidia bacterium]|nr:FAD:protein FMN transferase [Dehalococcoidia bacterium]